LCGHRVNPGDIIVADSDGVVIIPSQRLDEVIYQCEHNESMEQEMRDRVLSGKEPITEAKVIMKKKKIRRP
jgi:4-hydroxy-4-methyl-2-oxoglutarate aldolase